MRRAATVLLLMLLVTAPLTGQTLREIVRQLRESQNRLTDLREQRAGLERDLAALRGRVHTMEEELENIERQRTATGRLVNELDRQLHGLALEIEQATTELVIAENNLAVKRAVLRRRLVEIYKRGPLYAFQALLAAESFGDLLSRYKYLYLISRQDRQLTTSVERLRNGVARQRDRLLELRGMLSRRRNERSQERDHFQQLERRREQSLVLTRQDEEQAQRRLSQISAEEERVKDIVTRLERERHEAEARTGGEPGAPSISMADIGKLAWPLEGPVIYRFGAERGAGGVSIPWSGIGIGAPAGAPVRAIRAGRVGYAAPWGTYRMTVIIDHGGGFFSIYAMLRNATVTRGDYVTEGQTIGQVGDAVDRGPHLHFELREGQVALDPLTWLRRR